jgi:plasmid stabilization system protein ParE
MDFKIIWSDFSETQLDEIYEYYKKKASLKIATKIVTGIIKESEKLIKASLIGQEEELLKRSRNSISLFSFQKLQSDLFG